MVLVGMEDESPLFTTVVSNLLDVKVFGDVMVVVVGGVVLAVSLFDEFCTYGLGLTPVY